MILRRVAVALTTVVLLVCLPAGAATLGLYFDTETFPTEIEADGPVEAWLVLRGITTENVIAGWECSVEPLAEGADPVLVWELLGYGPYNFATPPQFAVGMQIPFPAGPEISLAHVTIIPTSAGQATDLHIQPFMWPSLADDDGHAILRPVIARNPSGEPLQLVEPAAGSSWHPEARVNPAGPVLPPSVAMTGDGHFGAVSPGGEEIRTLILNQPGPATVNGRLEVAGEDYAIRIDGGEWTGDGRWLALPPGEDVAVDLRFAPSFAGPAYGNLILADGGPLSVIALTGGGGEAPALVLEPDVLSFGSVPPGGTSQRTVVLRNTGSVPLTVTPGMPSPGFALIDPPGTVEIAPQGTLELTVAFVPPSAGLWLLELDLGPGLPPLLGSGYAAGTSGCVTEVADPDGGDFGDVMVGEPEERDVTFVNVGSWELAGDVHLEGDVEAFTIISGGGWVQVPAGGSHTVTVRCEPAAAGAWAAVLVGPESCSSVPLSCDAETLVIACERVPDLLDFGALVAGNELTLPVEVTNAGNVPLVGEVTLSGDAAFTIVTGAGPFTLLPGVHRTINVRFAPTAVGDFTGSLDLGTADCDPVPLVGVGLAPPPVCDVAPEAWLLGEVYVTQVNQETVTVTNAGSVPFAIDPIIEPSDSPFSHDGTARILEAGESADIVLRFESAIPGHFAATLSIGSASCDDVPLSATAVPLPADDVNLGLYFDPQTFPTEIEADGPVEAWLVLRGITTENVIAGWECSIETLADGGAPVMIWELQGIGPFNFATPPQFAVGLQTPFPAAPEITLAHVTIIPTSAGQAADLHVQPFMYPSLVDADGHSILRPAIARNPNGQLLQLVEPAAGSSWHPDARVNPAGLALPPSVAMTGDGHFGGVSPGGEEIRTLILNQPGPATVNGRLEVTGDDYAIRIDDGEWTDDGRWLALPPGEDVVVDLRFAPSFAGPSHGSLILEDGGPLRVIALTGGGGEAPALVLEPDVLSFGSVPPDGTSQRSVVLSNTGLVPLMVTPGTPSAGFELIDPPGTVEIAPQGTLELTVAFAPPLEGLWLLELDLGSGLPPLLGSGHAAGSSGCVTEVADPEGGDFGLLLVGETEERDVTFLNVGPWDITGDVHLEGDVEAFEIISGGGMVQVPAGGSHTVTVRCQPAAAGAWAAVLLGPESCSSVPLGCEAEAVVVACEREPDLLDFGTLVTGAEITLPVEVTNAGNVPLVGEVTLIGDAVFTIVAGGGPFTLLPGVHRTINVRFAPTAVGDFTGSLDLGTADCDPVPLVGAGVDPPPMCDVAPEAWLLGEVYVTTVNQETVTVTNAGSVPFAIDPIIEPSDSPFSHDGTARILAAGESADIVLRFESEIPGHFAATLSIGSASCDDVPLSATAVPLPADDVSLGLYFDPQTLPTEIEADGPVEAWLVLRGLTTPNLVSGWECSVEAPTDGADPIMVWELLGTGPYNFATPPQFAVGMQVPFPAAPQITLAHVTIYPASAGQAADLHVQPFMYPSLVDADGHSIWRPVIARNQNGELLQLVEPAAGSSWYPEARVNPAGPVLPPPVAMTGDGHFGAVSPGGEEIRTLILNQPGPATVNGRLEVTGDDYAIRIDDGEWTGDGRWLALPPGEDVALDLRFAPSFAGPAYGNLILADGGPLRVIALTGGGGEAPALVLEPDVMCFGSVPPDGMNQRSVVLHNTGMAPLMVMPGQPTPGFELIDPPGAVEIAPQDSLELTVAFVPSSEGLWLLELDLGSGLPPVLGRGHAAGSSGCVTEVSDPDAGDFGPVVVGLPVDRDVTFVNVGSWNLSGDVHLEGDLEAFTIVSGGGMVQVPAGGSHTATVRCDPEAAGAWAAVLLGPESCSSVPLSCDAVTMVVACERVPDLLDFGTLATDHELTLPVEVTNAGNVPLVGEVTVSGDAAFTIVTGAGPFTMPPGTLRTVEVRFAPTAVGDFTGSLDLGTADCDPVPLLGTGRDPAPICELDAEVLDFGGVQVGRTGVESLTVWNSGELPLTVEPLVSGEWFRLATDPGSVTLAPADSLILDIEFRSPAEGIYDGQLDLGHPGCAAVALTAVGEYDDNAVPCEFHPIVSEFPGTPVGGWSQVEVSVTNHNEATMTLAVTTTDPDVFAVTAGADLVLEPHTAGWLTLRFTPMQVREYDEQILSSTGCGAVLRGEGLESGCLVTPPALAFPLAPFGTELIETVTVTNNTPENLLLTPLTDHPAFIVDATPIDLPPQQQHALDVTFLADAPGEYTGVLDLGADVCAQVDLSATALDSVLFCEVTPENWLLGPVYVTMVYTQAVTVTNEGTLPFPIDPVIEPAGSPFSHDGTARILGAGETAEFTLRFQSAVTGEFTATLNIGSPGCDDIPLSATAMDLPPGDCELVPSALNLGEIPVGLFVTWQGTVTNLGSATIEVELDDQTDEVMFVSGGGIRNLDPGEAHQYTARFYAPQEGEFAYEVDFGNVEAVLTVEGYGTPPSYPCEIEPYVVDCGTVMVGQSQYEGFSIRNVSDTAMYLEIPDQFGPFAISGSGGRYLGPLSYHRPGVRFQPTEPGEYFLALDLGPDSCGPVLLRGTAVSSSTGVVALARSLDFGVLDAGETGTLVLEVANRGDQPVDVAPTVAGPGFGLVAAGGVRTAAPGETLAFGVTCLPSEPGLMRGRLNLGIDGHPDVGLTAFGRDPEVNAPVIAVPVPEGYTKSGGGPVLSGCELRITGLERGAELVGWRLVLTCEGGRVTDWRPAGETEAVGLVAGAPLVILPADPLRVGGDGAVTLATFTVEADGPGEVVLRVDGGAGSDWPLLKVDDTIDRDVAVVTVAADHVVARFLVEAPEEVPMVTKLRPVYPNPFNPATNIPFELARPSRVRLRIFDVSGRLVATVLDESRAAGSHLVRWEGRDDRGRGVASGTYYLRFEGGGVTEFQKMTLLK